MPLPQDLRLHQRENNSNELVICLEDPSLYLHTHLSENPNEIAWVKELFPECETYLDTYDNAGLLGRRSVFAHCIHLEDAEWKRMAETQCGIAFCPTSNLLFGSGLFNIKRSIDENIHVGIGQTLVAEPVSHLRNTKRSLQGDSTSRRDTLAIHILLLSHTGWG